MNWLYYQTPASFWIKLNIKSSIKWKLSMMLSSVQKWLNVLLVVWFASSTGGWALGVVCINLQIPVRHSRGPPNPNPNPNARPREWRTPGMGGGGRYP